eukprot:scaffold122512_cov60-Phaeocystis_antarctica.AAC.1
MKGPPTVRARWPRSTACTLVVASLSWLGLGLGLEVLCRARARVRGLAAGSPRATAQPKSGGAPRRARA